MTVTDKQSYSGAEELSESSGRNLADSLHISPISPLSESWLTSAELTRGNLHHTPDILHQVTNLLLGNPNFKSSHIFRADVLYDSLGILQTPEEKEIKCAQDVEGGYNILEPETVEPMSAMDFPSFKLKRTVIRRFIPRNINLDRPLEQTCHFYEKSQETANSCSGARIEGHENGREQDHSLVTYTPHCSSQEDLPFYHPALRALALLYEFDWDPSATLPTSESPAGTGALSIHFLPFPPNPPPVIPNRLERNLLCVLSTHIRLAKCTTTPTSKEGISTVPNPKPFKDNIIPQHITQNTYVRLKATYASDVIRDWVENTEPSKHVFEDIAIAAFLIELWRGMYGVNPLSDRAKNNTPQERYDPSFPGFVDIACGNGLLVYILIMEGYSGQGFDARRRKTWSIFPEYIQSQLKEEICIPKPLGDVLNITENTLNFETKTMSGIVDGETFIISNHADELTLWTPILATLSNPEFPLPFLAIPCCSHSLSGARYRYPPPKPNNLKKDNQTTNPEEDSSQPSTGDLRALRISKIQAQTDHNSDSHQSSTYGCLTAKVIAIAEEIGLEVEKTKLRIPSTRDMAIIGGRKMRRQVAGIKAAEVGESDREAVEAAAVERVHEVIERECSRDGGVKAAAEVWASRALSLRTGQGRGKVNYAGRVDKNRQQDDLHSLD